MRKFISVLVLVGYYIIICQTALAKVDENFRKGFPELVKNLCASTIDFDLDNDFASTKDIFHYRVNCLFNDAMTESVKGINKEVTDIFGAELWALDAPPEERAECQGMLNETQGIQQNIRLQNDLPPTICDITDEYDTVKVSYSACRVAETVWSEWCGYQKYLWAKKKDDQSLFKTKAGQTLEDLGTAQNTLVEEINQETDKTHQALLDTIFFYQTFEQDYRLHAWLVSIKQGLYLANSKIEVLQWIIKTWPDKFINAQRNG
ncbi:hypothetical protein K9M41_02860 [Candidatus Gracilibacteria bacterium]|nr:hypothetical protein [Candidatus Gracilibacteria bacterium]